MILPVTLERFINDISTGGPYMFKAEGLHVSGCQVFTPNTELPQVLSNINIWVEINLKTVS